MDKRLLKSLTTAKARYENSIADAQTKLHVVNSMLESLIAPQEEATPKEGDMGVTTIEEIFEGHTGQKLPAFIGKKTATV